MSVQAGPIFKRYAANGIATVYAIPFKVMDAGDLQITLDGVLVTTGFTLGALGGESASCTFSVPPTGDLLFQLVLPFQRLTDYQLNGDLLAVTINRDLDRIWLALKQLIGSNDRALSTDVTEPEGVAPLPLKAARALKVLAFDIDSNPITSTLTLEQLEQQPALALDSAELARQWAENPEDTPVIPPSQYSALHWAIKAANAGIAAGNSAISAASSASAALASENNAAATLATAQKQQQTISQSVAANALTLNWLKTPLTFRNASLSNGTPVSITPPAAPPNLSITIPAGATLGTVSGVLFNLMLLAINNAGTVELAIVNLAGGVNLDESGLINTTALSAASSSASTVYSTTARTGVPYRVIGNFWITNATAGQWAALGNIQGLGGQTFAALGSVGFGQTWQNLTGSRALSTIYRNTTSRPINLAIVVSITSATSVPRLQVDGVVVFGVGSANSSFVTTYTLAAIVPPGSTYQLDASTGSIAIHNWAELR